MLKLYNHYPVSVLHLEPTDVCQASCPLCARETDTNFNKDIHNHLTINQIENLFDHDFLRNLDKMFMCGNYGDPAAGKHTLGILSYFRMLNSDITLGMNTNGALQNKTWWDTLGRLFHKQYDYVVFSIDGLEDTNHIYRQGVNWQKLIENAKAYIATGASAHWDMLIYEHNKHQVDDCEKLAKQLGFTWFRAKVSKRQSNVEWLKPPKDWTNPVVADGEIDCFAIREQSIYVSAQGTVYPCCWLGTGTEYSYDTFDNVKASWQSKKINPICKQTCSTRANKSSFTAQWQRNVSLC